MEIQIDKKEACQAHKGLWLQMWCSEQAVSWHCLLRQRSCSSDLLDLQAPEERRVSVSQLL